MARRNSRSVSEAIVKYSGSPRYLGTIDFTSVSKTNGTATIPFNLASPGLAGKIIMMQSDQDIFILPVTSSATAVTSTNGVTIYANERVILTMDDIDPADIVGESYGWLAVLRANGVNGSLRVWELK